MNYKLLTPGPLTTSDTVKQSMLKDWCTWDDEYKELVEDLRSKILAINYLDKNEYTVVLMQGSGSFGVESTITSALSDGDKLLVLTNGAYGRRIDEIVTTAGRNVVAFHFDDTEIIDAKKIENILQDDVAITHVAFVHCETTTGILNPIKELSTVVKKHNKVLIVDAMSSLGGIPIDISGLGIDFIISSANKCIHGVPGFSFTIAKRDTLNKCKGNSTSLCLDMYDQWSVMEGDPGKWRFTSPTHVVRAFYTAISELIAEGGIESRHKRYSDNQSLLVNRMEELGYDCCIEKQYQSPIITTFIYPESQRFSFKSLYDYLKKYNYLIYPGKLSDLNVFRIGNIGEIYKEDIIILTDIIRNYNREVLGLCQ